VVCGIVPTKGGLYGLGVPKVPIGVPPGPWGEKGWVKKGPLPGGPGRGPGPGQRPFYNTRVGWPLLFPFQKTPLQDGDRTETSQRTRRGNGKKHTGGLKWGAKPRGRGKLRGAQRPRPTMRPPLRTQDQNPEPARRDEQPKQTHH